MAAPALRPLPSYSISSMIEKKSTTQAEILMDKTLGILDQQLMLAIIRLRPNAYGVALARLILDRTGKRYSVGAVYAALDRLEQKGFVTSKMGEPTAERGGRAKLFFDLTGIGRVALDGSLDAIDAMRKGLRGKEALA
jgi:PadR family transcriptional regulator PadR